MFHSREHRDLAPDHLAGGCLRIPADPVCDRGWQLRPDGSPRVHLKWRKFKRLVLLYGDLGIGNTDFRRLITPEKRNAPSGKKNARSDGYGAKSYGGCSLEWSRAQIGGVQSLFHLSSPS